LIVALVLFAGVAAAEEPAAPSAEDAQKLMEMWQQMAAPAPEHAALAKMAGDWTVSSKVWFGPGMDPQISEGTSHGEMILGGRYLAFEDHGAMMGAPFSGRGNFGYDKYRARFWMTWFDDMGTALFTANGAADKSGKVLTLLGKMDEPFKNVKDKDVKYVFRWLDDDTRQFEIYDEVGTPKEFKTVEMTYSRKK
jgi:hypothetical protein